MNEAEASNHVFERTQLSLNRPSSRWLANENCTMSSSLGKFFTNSRLGLTLRNHCFTNSRLVSAKDNSNCNVWNVALAFDLPILKAFRDSFFILPKDEVIIWSYVAQMVQRDHWMENAAVQSSNPRSSCFFFFFFSLLSSLFYGVLVTPQRSSYQFVP